MAYDEVRDLAAARGIRKARSIGDPATRAVKLTPAMLSDGDDLAAYAKALRIWNGSSAAVTLLVTPIQNADDTVSGTVPLTIPAGMVTLEPMSVRRIWSTGSTGLAAALAAGTVEVVLMTM